MGVQNIAVIIGGAFALIALVLAHTRVLLRDLARTVETWHDFHDALRRRRTTQATASEPDATPEVRQHPPAEGGNQGSSM